VQWVFVNMPLPMHPNAWAASEAAMCAGAANRFWPMHDRLYRGQAEWSGAAEPLPIFTRYAKEVGVPLEAFTACVMNDRMAALITNDVIYATSARITGTPTFIINDETSVVGLKTFEEWRDMIDAAAKKAAAKKTPE
jgi:protein-disulfide isomerase